MAKRTLYAYVSGDKNGAPIVHDDSVVAAVEQRLDALVAARKWIAQEVWVVNQREPPYWDLGLNLIVPTARARAVTFVDDDVVAVANELAALYRETSRPFVIGLHDAAADKTIDLFTVDSEHPDLEQLRTAIRQSLTTT